MNIVATADWHIHEFQEFSKSVPVIWDAHTLRFIESSTGKLMNSRLKNTLDGICDIRDWCVKNGIKYVLNAGDVFHKRGTISVNAFNAAYKVIESFKSAGLDLIIIAGNHDQVDATDNPATSIFTFTNIATVIESPTILKLSSANSVRFANLCGKSEKPTEDIQVLALPYSKNKNYLMSEFHRLKAQLDNPHRSILLAHLGIEGGIVGSGMVMVNEDYNLSDLIPEDWKYIVLGHFHRPQLLAPNALYTGTPVQNSFSDELPITYYGGYNGFYILGEEEAKFMPILRPRFITVTNPADITDKDYFRIKSTEETVISESNVRVEVQKDYSQPIRSKITLGDSFEDSILKYMEENYKLENKEEVLKLGQEILLEAREIMIE